MNERLRAWIEVDLGALVRNGAAMAARAGVPILPMVKADGYGLGAVAVARALERLSPWGYGVATVDEGAEIRAAGVERPVLVFTPILEADIAGARECEADAAAGLGRDDRGVGGGNRQRGLASRDRHRDGPERRTME